MRKLSLIVIIGLLSILLNLVIFTPPMFGSANVIWNESFDQSDLNDWTILGWNRTDATPFSGNLSVESGVLRFQGIGSQESATEHSSTQATGTWSFDLDVTHTIGEHFHISFFGGKFGDVTTVANFTDALPYEYGIMVVTAAIKETMWDSEFVFYKRNEGAAFINPLARYSPDRVIGWHHFDITRNSLGEFNIFINGTHCKSFTDQTFTTTEVFRLSSAAGPAIDNIVIQDEIIITPSKSTFTTSTSNQVSYLFGIFITLISIMIMFTQRKLRRG